MAEISATPSLASGYGFKVPPVVGVERGWQEIDLYAAQDEGDHFAYAEAGVGILALLKEVSSLVMNHFGERFLKKITQKKTPRQETIDIYFKTSNSLSEAVKRTKEGWQDMTPESALRTGLNWIYENYNFCIKNWIFSGDGIVSAIDIRNIKESCNFTNEQLFNILFEVNDSHSKKSLLSDGYSYKEIWSTVFSAIVNSDLPAKASATIIDTRELMKQGMDELKCIEREVTKGLFERFVSVMGAMELPSEGAASLSIGGVEIKINQPQVALTAMYDILGKIASGEALSNWDEKFINSLKGSDPVIQQVYDIATTPIKEKIKGRELMHDMMKLSKSGSPVGEGLSKFFEEMKKTSETMLLRIYDEAGRRLFPRLVVRGLANGDRIAEYEMPYYVEPFSYRAGKVYVVKGSEVVVEEAVTMIDGRGKHFFVTKLDMEHFGRLAEAIISNKSIKGSEFGRAFLRFFNTIQAVYMAVDPSYKPAPGSPKDVGERAGWLKESNWINALEREVGGVGEDFFNVSARVLGRQINPANGHIDGALEGPLHKRIEDIAGRYKGSFTPARQKEFEGALKGLERAILKGDVDLLEKACDRIQKLASDQLGGINKWLTWIRLQDLAGDARTLRRVSVKELLGYFKGYFKTALPAPLRDFLAVWTSNPDLMPSLEKARRLWGEGSYDEAFAEHERFARSIGINTNKRIHALFELATRAHSAGQITRAGRALHKINRILLSGFEIPEDVKYGLRELFRNATKDDPVPRLGIPRNLWMTVMAGDAPAAAKSYSLYSKRLFKRFNHLSTGVKKQIESIVESWANGSLSGYNKDFLKMVAACNDVNELWEFITERKKDVFTEIKGVEELKILEPFLKEVYKITEPKVEVEAKVETKVEAKAKVETKVKAGVKSYEIARDIGAPAVVGAATFLGAQRFWREILGEPETHIEGVAQGYTVIGTAVLIDHGLQKGAEYFIWKGLEKPFAPVLPFGLKSFFGNLGSAVVVYRGVEGAAKGAGMSDGAAEVTGLVGTGVAYGAWRPVINKLFDPARAADIIKTGENILTKGGLFYFVVDAVPTLGEAIYNIFDDDVSVAAREEWYTAMKAYHERRGIFGDEEGVPWYERASHSLFNTLDTFVPAAWHKGLDPLVDSQTKKWITWCEGRLRTGQGCH